jgi:hypothetical protein
MQTKTKHTPTPWRVGERYPSRVLGSLGSGVIVAFCSDKEDEGFETEREKADAELIIRAVNAHEELLEAVKTLHHTFGDTHIGSESCKFCRIIAKAEGK